MNIWNKVLLGVLIVLSLGCFYLAIGTLHVHRKWRNEANILLEGAPGRQGIREAQIDQQELQNELLKGRAELYKWLVARGRAWKIGGADLAQPPATEETAAEVFWQVQTDVEANARVVDSIVGPRAVIGSHAEVLDVSVVGPDVAVEPGSRIEGERVPEESSAPAVSPEKR